MVALACSHSDNAKRLSLLPRHLHCSVYTLKRTSFVVTIWAPELAACQTALHCRNPKSHILCCHSDIAKHLSLPPVKLHCSMLAEDAIKAAVRDIQAKKRSSSSSGEEAKAAVAGGQ